MIPNQWYAISRVQDVKKKPIGIKRLNKLLVLYRDTKGELVCMDDKCPHKGVMLSRGKQHGDIIACPYHGFQFDQKGDCVHMPVLGKNGDVPKGMCVKTYKVKEEFGLIWFWYGDLMPEIDYPEVPMFKQFKEYKGYYSFYGWDAPINYTRYVESVCEIYHIPFVHKGSAINIWDPKGGKVDNFECKVDGTLITSDFVLRPDDERTAEETLVARKPWTRGWKFGIDVQMPNLVLIRSDVFDVMFIPTPIDENTCWVCVCYQEPKRDLLLPLIKPLPIPFWRPVRPWYMCRIERFVQQDKDMAVISYQNPKVSSPKANRLIPLDKVNAHYIRFREKLIREANEEKALKARLQTKPQADIEAPSLEQIIGIEEIN